jgi:small-conductance mechanosensitive channel
MDNLSWSNMLEMLRLYALQGALAALKILLLLLLGLVAARVLRGAFSRLQKKLEKVAPAAGHSPDLSRRASTIIGLGRTIVTVALWTVLGIMMLSQLGLDIGPILAGAGILGLAVSFGAQNLVRDFLSGIFFVLEDAIRVGDVAAINGVSGVVEHISFRTVQLRDFSGTLHVFAHGQVNTLANMTKDWSAALIEVGVAYQSDLERALEVMGQAASEMQAEENWREKFLAPPEVLGVENFADSAIVLRIRLRTRPGEQWAVGREYRKRLKQAFERVGIEIPYPQRVVHAGRGLSLMDKEPARKAG